MVVDASVAACWVLPDERTPSSIALLDRVADRSIRFIVPELWRYEMLNVVRNALVRQRLSDQGGMRALAILADVPVEAVGLGSGRQATILSVALQYGLSVYDATYVELAQERGAELVTRDRDLLKLRDRFDWVRTLDELAR
ncbi:type II toxin-antitoxin system VapC family toxin [bacterium]|nr:type II toxin-antitoxin system VapC family toxin [bacterium]